MKSKALLASVGAGLLLATGMGSQALSAGPGAQYDCRATQGIIPEREAFGRNYMVDGGVYISCLVDPRVQIDIVYDSVVLQRKRPSGTRWVSIGAPRSSTTPRRLSRISSTVRRGGVGVTTLCRPDMTRTWLWRSIGTIYYTISAPRLNSVSISASYISRVNGIACR